MAVPTSSSTFESAVGFVPIESKTAGLEFVTISNPKDLLTASNQRRIRQHIGKSIADAGQRHRKAYSRTFELVPKPSPSVSPKPIFRTNLTTSRPPQPFVSNVEYYSADDSFPAVPVSGLNDWHQFPVETTSRMRELVSFVCHKATTVYNPTFGSWFRIALTDMSAFYMTLSNAALELARLQKGESGDQLSEDNEALRLYNISLQNVQLRLQDPSDDGPLGGILGFACRDVTTGNFTRSTMHLRGLGRVLDARGLLLAKTTTDFRIMLFDIDVFNSFAQDLSPLFPAPLELCQDVFDHYLQTSSPALAATLAVWLDHFTGDADVISAFRWVAALTMFAKENSSITQFWMEDNVKHMTLVVLHRLLSLKRYDLSIKTGPELEAREVIRLALIVFLGHFKHRIGFIHGGNAASYCDRIRCLTDCHPDWSALFGLQLWTLVVCGIEQSQPATAQEWYSHQLALIMLQMGLRDWSSAMNIVYGLVWLDDLVPDRVEMLGMATEIKLNELISSGSSFAF